MPPESVIVVLSPRQRLVSVAAVLPPVALEFTVNVAALEIAGGLQVPLTTQSKLLPESPAATPVSSRFVVIEPLMEPPSLIGDPFSRH